ncbi:MAG: hypothetical protein LBL24_08280 [Bacteroidales bacterium]|nr:hypothetical protein [Bacteroidales bacterium]
MMNLLRRFVDVFRIDSIDMNALTGKACTECFTLAIGCRKASNVDSPVLRFAYMGYGGQRSRNPVAKRNTLYSPSPVRPALQGEIMLWSEYF